MIRNSGQHIIAEFYNCKCDEVILCSLNSCFESIKDMVINTGLTIVDEASHQFKNAANENSGYTITVLLAESHLCIHTWHEFNSVTLDIYVCNYLTNNTDKANALLGFCKSLYKAQDCDIKVIQRKHAKTHKAIGK